MLQLNFVKKRMRARSSSIEVLALYQPSLQVSESCVFARQVLEAVAAVLASA